MRKTPPNSYRYVLGWWRSTQLAWSTSRRLPWLNKQAIWLTVPPVAAVLIPATLMNMWLRCWSEAYSGNQLNQVGHPSSDVRQQVALTSGYGTGICLSRGPQSESAGQHQVPWVWRCLKYTFRVRHDTATICNCCRFVAPKVLAAIHCNRTFWICGVYRLPMSYLL